MPMSEHEVALWNMSKRGQNKYNELIELLRSYPELTNSINKTGDDNPSYLMQVLDLMTSEKEVEGATTLALSIAKNVAFNTFYHVNSEGKTAINAILSTFNASVLEHFAARFSVVYNVNHLTIKDVERSLGFARKRLEGATKDNTIQVIPRATKNVANLERMYNLVYQKTMARDRAILDAINIGNTAMLETLLQAEPTGSFNTLLPLMDGQNWKTIAEKQGKTEIVAWYETTEKKQQRALAFRNSLAALTTSRDTAFKTLQATEKELQQKRQEYSDAKHTLAKKALENDGQLLDTMMQGVRI